MIRYDAGSLEDLIAVSLDLDRGDVTITWDGLSGTDGEEVYAVVPCVAIDTSADLSDMIGTRGSCAAPLTTLGGQKLGAAGEKIGREVKQAVQSAHFTMNKDGAECAAETAVVVGCTGCLPPRQPRTIIVDEPFHFWYSAYGFVCAHGKADLDSWSTVRHGKD